MRFIRLLFGLAASLVLAACGGGWGDAAGPSALSPQSAAVVPAATSTSTRQYVDGAFIETGADTVPAQVNRLYRAVFGRPADDEGLGFHVASIERYGRTLAEVANGFIASPEFQTTYGNLTDAEFVTLLYTNVLHRQPDESGFSYWMDQLAAGTSRAQVVLGFSESTENKDQTAADVVAGLKFLPYPSTRVYLADGTYAESNPDGTTGQVYRLYRAAFGRTPDTSGLGFQVGSIETYGLSLDQVAQNFIASPEFMAKYGSLDNTAFVTLLYANVLHRAPDPQGLAYHVANLDSGVSRASVLVGFSESPENKVNTSADIAAGIRFVPYPSAPTEPAIALAAVKPRIVTQPRAETTITNGALVTLSAEAAGYGSLSYQWSRGGVPIPGATSSSYSFKASYGEDGTGFTLAVKNGLGDVASNVASLFVEASTAQRAVGKCVQILTSGSYVLTANLTGSGGIPCISIRGAQGVQFDCAGHTLAWDSVSNTEGLEITRSRNFSVKNCVLQVSTLKITASTNGSFSSNRIVAADFSELGYAVVKVQDSSLMTLDSNAVLAGVFEQSYGDRNTFSRNTLAALTSPYAGSGVVTSSFGSGNRLWGNTIDGRSLTADIGALDGVVVQDETDTVVEDNAILGVRNCGVTFVGAISGLTVQRNTFDNARGCGIGGSAWLSVSNTRIADNTATGSPMLFNLQRKYGLRAAGFDDAHKLPAETGVFFRDNTFSGNKLVNPSSADGMTYTWSAYIPLGNRLDYDGQVSAAAGEQVAAPSVFSISNNTFTANDFGHLARAPWLGSVVPQGMVIDGGGNACSAPEIAAYPLTCN